MPRTAKGEFLRAIAAGVLAVFLPVAASAASWWNGDWKFRKEITFDLSPTGADIKGSVQDVPVLIRLSLANFAYFGDTKPDAADFRVIDGDDKTPLKFHFERYDPQNQMAYLWVRVPRLTGGAKSDKLFIYYGNSDAQAAGDAPATFDTDTVLVLEGAGDAPMPQDSTAYKNNASASTAEKTPASLIAGGFKVSGGQSITVPSSPTVRVPANGFTASAWVKLEGPQSQATVLGFADNGLELTLGVDGARAFARMTAGGPPVTASQSGSELAPGQWHQLAVTVGGGQLTLFVDGAMAASAPIQGREIAGNLTIGAAPRGGGALTGELDEVVVSRVARSADWIRANGTSQGVEAPLVIYGADGQKEGASQGSYFGTIAKNLTVDGWVIIAICFAMLLVALSVIVLKALYLRRIERMNSGFLRDYAALSTGGIGALDSNSNAEEAAFEKESPTLAALAGDGGKYGASTLFRLYHIGVHELNKRLAYRNAPASAGPALSPQSIEAIRVSMDAGLTRLQQQLAAQMVLLTIAISGGPFLGLLGTVIGVMITFAAIAASGDVNVNAIAPGTAAALAATVAGLSVAIPALFGYNWLNTRIKAVVADNRVFVDEFISRVAETHS